MTSPAGDRPNPPAEAVEAAARADFVFNTDRRPPTPWEQVPESIKVWFRGRARTVLAAAAPHLRATDRPSEFERLLADPDEQFDQRSELLASIAAYANAPSGTASSASRPKPLRPGPAPQRTCGEEKPIFWWYESGAAVCGDCLEQELLERDQLRLDLAAALAQGRAEGAEAVAELAAQLRGRPDLQRIDVILHIREAALAYAAEQRTGGGDG